MDYSHLDKLKLRREVEEGRVFVAELSGSLVGYLRLEYIWHKVPFISLIIVKEGFRGRGIGKAMLNFVENYLKAKGYKFLYSSSQANEPGPQAWHRKMGFEECGFIAGINEGGVGEIVFRKKLS